MFSKRMFESFDRELKNTSSEKTMLESLHEINLKEEYDGEFHYTYQPYPDGPEVNSFEEALEIVNDEESGNQYTSITMYRYKYDPKEDWEDDVPHTSEDVWTREKGIIADWLTEEKQCECVKTEDIDSDNNKQVFEVTIYDNQNNIVSQFEEIKADNEDEAKNIALDLIWEDSDDAWEIEHMSDEEFKDVFGENTTFEDVKQSWKDDYSVTVKFVNKE